MIPVIVGISSGLILIFLFVILKQFEKKAIYGLILTGIGFLYVGFVWTDMQLLIINSIQAVFFLFLAYFGISKSLYILVLAAGFFLHGCWDIIYNLIAVPGLIPPQYELFCLAIDFTIGIYILLLNKHLRVN